MVKIIKTKKAYIRTLEAVIAFFVTFSFLIYIVHGGILPKPEAVEQYILNDIEKKSEFRNCVYVENTTCIERLVSGRISSDYDHKVTINELQPFTNTYDIRVEQLMIVGNTSRDFNIVKLYYWKPG